jgi:hypothetical protein
MPLDLSSFSLGDMLRCGLDLRSRARTAHSVEQAAEAITAYLYDELVDASTGNRACALVRCYKTHSYGELPPDLQAFARHALGRNPRSPATKCLTLLGTSGDRPEWNSRFRSIGHQAIPLESEQMVEQAPMIAQLIKEFGLDLGDVIAPTPEILRRVEGKSSSVFYVPKARGSPYIPAQEGFVIRERIESVLGFGGMLRKGDLLAMILFSRTPISEETAGRFRTLALDVRAGLFSAGELPAFRVQELASRPDG